MTIPRGRNGIAMPAAPNGRVYFDRQVEFNRFPSQRRFDDLHVRYKGFSGPIGSGKSKSLCMEAIRMAYINSGTIGLVGAPTYRLLADSTQVELLGTLQDKRIPFHFYPSSDKIYLPEPNSTILLRTLDNPERLRAMNLAWFGVDELTYCKEASWVRLEGRLRDPRARYQSGFAVWTPKGKDWVWRKFISSRRVSHYYCVQAQPFENRAILGTTPDFYERLKVSYDEKFYRQEVLGEYLDMYSGSVYHGFREENIRLGKFNPKLPLIVALDFNVNPMAGALMQCETVYGRKQVHVLTEIVLPGSHTAAWLEVFIARTAAWADACGYPLQVQWFGDATGTSMTTSSGGESNWSLVRKFMANRQNYQSRFLYANKNPAVIDRVNAMNAMLCSFGDGHKRAGDRRLFIDPACRELLMDLEEVKWKVDAAGTTYHEIDKKADPKRTHISDAVGYYIEEEFGLRSGGKFLRDMGV